MKKSIGIILSIVLIIVAIVGFVLYKKEFVDNRELPGVKTEALTYPTFDSSMTTTVPEVTVEDPTVTPTDEAQRILNSMTIEQKIYQMFIVEPEALGNKNIDEAIKQRPVGGIVYFAKHLTGKKNTIQMLSDTTKAALVAEGMIPFLCVDEEGGRVLRVGSAGYGYEQVGPMGKVTSEDEAYKCGSTIGSYLKELGFTVDFAPDADVITNPDNKVIGDRSFGTNPDVVTKYANAFANGLHSQGILSTFKHFPGHGGTVGDTHEGFAYTDKKYEQLFNEELVPFRGAQKNNIDFVMVAHISVPNIIGDNTPCSLSRKMITDVLRGELEYEGLIITDSLEMGAIINKYTTEQAVVMAVEAGADIILMPASLDTAFNAVRVAVSNGRISEERINQSVLRIINAKLKMKE